MLIVGSQALNKFIPSRIPKDIDVICLRSEVDMLQTLFFCTTRIERSPYKTILRNGKFQVECMISDDLPGFRSISSHTDGVIAYAPLIDLFFLKLSHIHRGHRFKKHIEDLENIRKQLKLTTLITDKELKILTLLKKDQTTIHGKKVRTPKLNKSSDEFFDDKTRHLQVFNHDDIHKVMAHREKPMYEYMQKEGSEVLCSKKLWNNLSELEQMQCVLEESYVIALERKLIPHTFLAYEHWSNKEAFDWALMRICTTLCSGWFRTFAVNNYFKIQELYNESYLDTFIEAFDNKEIKQV